MHGENAEKAGKIGMEYFKSRGFMKKLNFWFSVSKNNKPVKRLTHKRERKEIKTYLNNKEYDIF